MGDRFDERNLAATLNHRMGWAFDDPKCPYRRVFAVKAGEKVAVLAVWGDQYQCIEDEAALYPSDTLVTKLRMLAPPKE